jgi:uncharacterized protein (UPF0332 family)
MSMNFDRQRAQVLCETFLNCSNLDEWNNADFKSFELSRSNAISLQIELAKDAKDLYFKGLLSLFESINSAKRGLFSWATVKAYYSVFYLLKSTCALNNIGFIRQKSLYMLKAFENEKPLSKNNKKYNTDHGGVINYFNEIFTSDILLSQNIEGFNAHNWMMDKREIVNYREVNFKEPNCPYFWDLISERITDNKFDTLISEYVSDNYVLCFQEEHAILAIPLKRALSTRKLSIGLGMNDILTAEQKEVLVNIYNLDSINTLL